MMTAWVTNLKICGHLTTNVSTAREAEHASKELEEEGEKALSLPLSRFNQLPLPHPHLLPLFFAPATRITCIQKRDGFWSDQSRSPE